MGYAEMLALKRPSMERSVEEGVSGLPMPDPIDLYEKDLKDMEYYMDKRFTMEFLLRLEDVFDPVRKTYLSAETSYSTDGNTVFTSKFYKRTLRTKEIVSNILNDVDFYLQSYDDVVRLHSMLYELFRHLEDANTTMGLKNVINPYVLDKLKKYILRMEDKDNFIIISKAMQYERDKNKAGFIEIRQSEIKNLNPNPIRRSHDEFQPTSYSGRDVNPDLNLQKVSMPTRPGKNRKQAEKELVQQQMMEESSDRVELDIVNKRPNTAYLKPKVVNINQEPVEYVTNGELITSKNKKKKIGDHRIMVDFS